MQSTRAHLPEGHAKIVFDKFYVVRHLHAAVVAGGAASTGPSRATAMSGSRSPSPCGCADPRTCCRNSAWSCGPCSGKTSKVGRAWALKERFHTFCEDRYPEVARTFFARWYWRATHSRFKPMAAVAKLMQRHLPNLLNYLRHRLTNAGLEGTSDPGNQETARGFRNAEHFKTAIYFHCGGLDLYPHESR